MSENHLPKNKYLVVFGKNFKDGTLFNELVAAGCTPVEMGVSVIKAGSKAWLNWRLFEKLKNSGGDSFEVIDTRLDIPKPTGPTSQAKEEPIPEGLEPITLEDLNMTQQAYELAKANNLHPVELLDTLGVLDSMTVDEKRFNKGDVVNYLETLPKE